MVVQWKMFELLLFLDSGRNGQGYFRPFKIVLCPRNLTIWSVLSIRRFWRMARLDRIKNERVLVILFERKNLKFVMQVNFIFFMEIFEEFMCWFQMVLVYEFDRVELEIKVFLDYVSKRNYFCETRKVYLTSWIFNHYGENWESLSESVRKYLKHL